MRQKYRCTRCGLRIEGRMDKQGRIRACDRAGSSREPEAKILCKACADERGK